MANYTHITCNPLGLFQLDTVKHIWVLATSLFYFNQIYSSIYGCLQPLRPISIGYQVYFTHTTTT